MRKEETMLYAKHMENDEKANIPHAPGWVHFKILNTPACKRLSVFKDTSF